MSAPIIVALDWSLQFELMCDASGVGLGDALDQIKASLFHLVYCASNTLNIA